jgi:putative SOS response-associated peptidase YedK
MQEILQTENQMCRRFSLHPPLDTALQRTDVTAAEFTRAVGARFDVNRVLFPLAPRYNIAPGARISVVTQGRETGAKYLEGYHWGLIPSWADDPEMKRRLINARAETIARKAAFRDSLVRRRCLIPASGFFEWKSPGHGERVPLHVQSREKYFAFAGVWDEWITPEGWPLRTVALVTTEANRLLAPLHHRMPAILRREDEAAWLDPTHQNTNELTRLLQPYKAERLKVFAVSPRASHENFNQPAAVTPLENSSEVLRRCGIEVEKKKLPPRKRVVQREYSSPDGQVFFKTRSFSRDDYTFWHPVVDTHDGSVHCDCPDFRFRHAGHDPSLARPQHWCKHINRAVENCRRHGEI